MIGGAIREARTGFEALFLLTDYIETKRYWRRTNRLPGRALRLPVHGAHDVRMRIAALDAELYRPGADADPGRVEELRDARRILQIALERLTRAEPRCGDTPAGAARRGGLLEAA
ncbi:MAG: hypothetical protein OHK0026_08760 [Rhodocyclaceae bacterium]